jgi:cytochrome P450
VFPWLLKLSRYVTVPVLSEAAATAPQIRKYSEESMQRYRSLVAADPYNVKPSLFTKLFLAKDEEKLTFNEVRDDAVTYIIAGSDTTAITLTYLVWCVTRDAALRDDLVREVQALPDDFSHQHVHHLPCLNMVIEETLRLYSPLSSALPRLVPREGAEIGGYRFPGGATVATQAYTMHRDPVIFPQPERFDPGRWAQPTKAMKEALLAFGGGSRVCLGIHLARMELRVTVAKFFRTFPNAVHSSVEGMTEEEMEPAMYFLLSPKGKRCLIKAW